MRKLIVGLMLLFFSVNVFAWDVKTTHYASETSKEATNASEACEEMGGANALISIFAFSGFAIAAITSIIQYFLAPETPETNSDGSAKNYAGKWAVYAGAALVHAVFAGVNFIFFKIYK
ncbi:hypothetical protein AGMMS49573_10080 [Endomicrobiia bacterium]|nr:hypothetical protein AGMMS49573_10080 [Endomicrobiia bacterium]